MSNENYKNDTKNIKSKDRWDGWKLFPGQPKYHKGQCLGEGSWGEDKKWAFALTERGSLDTVLVQAPSNISHEVLLPIIDKHCRDVSFFCSNGWTAYNILKDHLQPDVCLHFSVNHSNNYVDPHAGVHTSVLSSSLFKKVQVTE